MDFAKAQEKLTEAYIRRNPVCGPRFEAFYSGGIRRGKDYRYEADFNVLFPESKLGDIAEAKCAYVSGFDASIGMKLTLFGPMEVWCQDMRIFKSSIFEERENDRDIVLNVKVKKGVNIFRFIFQKTPLGFGGKFGTHLAKWDYVFKMPDRLQSEGVAYRLNGGEWLPKYEEEKRELDFGYALFYSKTEDGKEVFIKKDCVEFPEDKGFVNPFGIEGMGAWIGLWPLTKEHDNIDFLSVYENTYWRFKYKNVWLRPYYEASCYGMWNYPLGVTLLGLMASGEKCAEEYVKGHIETTLHEIPYALWDREKHGGATSLHNLLSSIDSLDDCGAFGGAVEEAMIKYGVDGRWAMDYVSDYIEHRQPRTEEGAFCRKNQLHSFQNDTMWLDDLYMSVPFLARRYKLTGDEKYLNDAVNQYLCYEKIFRMETGLMSHVYDMRHKMKTGVAWGRGNGWCIFSLTELLKVLPKSHLKREKLEKFFISLAEAYIKYQSEDGRWRQVIDEEDAYLETSVTAMLTASFMRGVRMGLLGDEFAESAMKGALSIVKNAIDEDGNLYGVCRGSEFAFRSDYYKQELLPRENDNHGVGIVLIALSEVLKGAK